MDKNECVQDPLFTTQDMKIVIQVVLNTSEVLGHHNNMHV